MKRIITCLVLVVYVIGMLFTMPSVSADNEYERFELPVISDKLKNGGIDYISTYKKTPDSETVFIELAEACNLIGVGWHVEDGGFIVNRDCIYFRCDSDGNMKLVISSDSNDRWTNPDEVLLEGKLFPCEKIGIFWYVDFISFCDMFGASISMVTEESIQSIKDRISDSFGSNSEELEFEEYLDFTNHPYYILVYSGTSLSSLYRNVFQKEDTYLWSYSSYENENMADDNMFTKIKYSGEMTSVSLNASNLISNFVNDEYGVTKIITAQYDSSEHYKQSLVNVISVDYGQYLSENELSKVNSSGIADNLKRTLNYNTIASSALSTSDKILSDYLDTSLPQELEGFDTVSKLVNFFGSPYQAYMETCEFHNKLNGINESKIELLNKAIIENDSFNKVSDFQRQMIALQNGLHTHGAGTVILLNSIDNYAGLTDSSKEICELYKNSNSQFQEQFKKSIEAESYVIGDELIQNALEKSGVKELVLAAAILTVYDGFMAWTKENYGEELQKSEEVVQYYFIERTMKNSLDLKNPENLYNRLLLMLQASLCCYEFDMEYFDAQRQAVSEMIHELENSTSLNIYYYRDPRNDNVSSDVRNAILNYSDRLIVPVEDETESTEIVDIPEESQLPAIVQTVYENEKMWLDNINDLATEYSDVQFGHNECWFQDLDMDGTPEFIVGGMGLGLSEAISQVYHIYKYSNGELKQMQVNNNKFLEVTWDGKSPNYGSAGFELIQQFINNKTNSIVLTEKHKYNYTSGPVGGVISFSDYKISGTQLKSDSNYIVYCSVDGNGEITGNYRVHTQEDETDEKSFIKTYDDFFADLTPYKTTIKAVPCSDESIDMPNNYDQMTADEKKQALLDSYNAWSYEVDTDAELPLESYIDKLRKTLSSTTENSEAETALSSACSTLCLGQGNSAAITKEGFLYTWGKNIFGNLGNGTTEDSSTPVKIMDKAKYVALGDSYSAAITDDGSLYMWGNNQYATLGDGTTKRSLIPVKIMDNVKYVVLQERYCAAITEDGSLYMWGNNQYGKLGNGTTKDSLIPVKIMDNVKTVSLSYSYCGAITEDGSLYMWGGNWCNQLGDGTSDNRLTPVKVMDNIKMVCLENGRNAAITNDNSLYMWGCNDEGQLGDGTTKNSPIPIKIMDNVKSISLGNSHSGAITYDGTLYVWGDNGYGQLGLKTVGCLTPTKAIDNIKSINFVGDTTAAITEDNILYICGRNIEGTVADVSSVSIGRICLGGDNHYGVIKNDGYVYMWGDNGFGELGNGKQGTFEGELTPTKIEMG